MEEERVQNILEQLKRQPFPFDEMGVLEGLAKLCGTKDLALLCAVCYLYGEVTARGVLQQQFAVNEPYIQ